MTGEYLEAILTSILSKFDKNVPVTMSFRQASFASGFDFKEFMKEYGIELQQSEVEQ